MQGERLVAQHARRQAGVFSRSQAVAAEMTRRQIEYRLDQGVWLRSFPGVYRLASAPRSAEQRCWAAMLWAGDGVLSHRSAGALWRLDEVTARTPELWVPASSHKRNEHVILHRGAVDDADRRRLDGLYVTSVERTLLDLASVLEGAALEIAFESARRDRNVTGRYRLDFAWPERLVALECEGRDPHARVRAFQPDRTRAAALAADGWRILPVTHDDVTRRGDEVLSRVARALAAG